MSSGAVVTMKHLRSSQFCMRGARAWWRDHDLDWNDFLVNGIPADRLAATGDPLAAVPVALARAEHESR